MTVSINFLNFGSPPITSFSDTMANAAPIARNLIVPPTDDWIYLPLGGDTPTAGCALPEFLFATLLAGGGGTGCGLTNVSYAFTTYSFAAGICPRTMFVGSRYYTAQKKFVQITFNDISNGVAGIGMTSYVDTSGTGVAGSSNICHDAYIVQWGAASWGMVRYNSVANPTTLFAPVGALAQGDVMRIACDFSTAGQVTIITSRNGVVQSTVVDNNANRLPVNAFPVFEVTNMAGAFSGGVKNFSCGVGL